VVEVHDVGQIFGPRDYVYLFPDGVEVGAVVGRDGVGNVEAGDRAPVGRERTYCVATEHAMHGGRPVCVGLVPVFHHLRGLDGGRAGGDLVVEADDEGVFEPVDVSGETEQSGGAAVLAPLLSADNGWNGNLHGLAGLGDGIHVLLVGAVVREEDTDPPVGCELAYVGDDPREEWAGHRNLGDAAEWRRHHGLWGVQVARDDAVHLVVARGQSHLSDVAR